MRTLEIMFPMSRFMELLLFIIKLENSSLFQNWDISFGGNLEQNIGYLMLVWE